MLLASAAAIASGGGSCFSSRQWCSSPVRGQVECLALPRYYGPVAVRDVPGKGRGVVALRDLAPGELVLVSQPINVIYDDDEVGGSNKRRFTIDDLLADVSNGGGSGSGSSRAQGRGADRDGGSTGGTSLNSIDGDLELPALEVLQLSMRHRQYKPSEAALLRLMYDGSETSLARRVPNLGQLASTLNAEDEKPLVRSPVGTAALLPPERLDLIAQYNHFAADTMDPAAALAFVPGPPLAIQQSGQKVPFGQYPTANQAALMPPLGPDGSAAISKKGLASAVSSAMGGSNSRQRGSSRPAAGAAASTELEDLSSSGSSGSDEDDDDDDDDDGGTPPAGSVGGRPFEDAGNGSSYRSSSAGTNGGDGGSSASQPHRMPLRISAAAPPPLRVQLVNARLSAIAAATAAAVSAVMRRVRSSMPPLLPDLSPGQLSKLVAVDRPDVAQRMRSLSGFIGVWPEASWLNHSCVANTTRQVVGDCMVVRASRPIRRGEELTQNYLGLLAFTPLRVRQRALEREWRFHCGCTRCVAEAALPQSVQSALAKVHATVRRQLQPVVWACVSAPELQGSETAVVTMREVAEVVNTIVQEMETVLSTQWGEQQQADALGGQRQGLGSHREGSSSSIGLGLPPGATVASAKRQRQQEQQMLLSRDRPSEAAHSAHAALMWDALPPVSSESDESDLEQHWGPVPADDDELLGSTLTVGPIGYDEPPGQADGAEEETVEVEQEEQDVVRAESSGAAGVLEREREEFPAVREDLAEREAMRQVQYVTSSGEEDAASSSSLSSTAGGSGGGGRGTGRAGGMGGDAAPGARAATSQATSGTGGTQRAGLGAAGATGATGLGAAPSGAVPLVYASPARPGSRQSSRRSTVVRAARGREAASANRNGLAAVWVSTDLAKEQTQAPAEAQAAVAGAAAVAPDASSAVGTSQPQRSPSPGSGSKDTRSPAWVARPTAGATSSGGTTGAVRRRQASRLLTRQQSEWTRSSALLLCYDILNTCEEFLEGKGGAAQPAAADSSGSGSGSGPNVGAAGGEAGTAVTAVRAAAAAAAVASTSGAASSSTAAVRRKYERSGRMLCMLRAVSPGSPQHCTEAVRRWVLAERLFGGEASQVASAAREARRAHLAAYGRHMTDAEFRFLVEARRPAGL